MTAHRAILSRNDPEVFALIAGEERRQQTGLELIPSENYTCPEVLAALGSVFTNKYAEGYPGRRYYGGQEYTDAIERLACERARALFRCEHANVQALSGSAMNQAAYLGLLEPGDTVLSLDLSHGGHLTHGAPVSHMGRIFNFVRYRTRACDGRIDPDEVMALARAERPRLVLCGSTSHPREDDYAAFRRIADEVGALAMADISHLGGLVAGGALENPFDHGFDVVTTTTHKSLRGPRGGLVLCRRSLADRLDRSVFPGLQGGPHMHTIAAIAIALGKAAEPAFARYAHAVLENARALADELSRGGASLVTGGTGTHLIVMNTIESFGLDGRRAEAVLDRIGLPTNKQIVPDDPNPAMRPSGIRLGTPALTTRGLGVPEVRSIGRWLLSALRNPQDEAHLDGLAAEVRALSARFPAPA